MAENSFFKLEGEAYQPSFLDSLLYKAKKLFQSPPQLPDPPVPYDIVNHPVSLADIKSGNQYDTETYNAYISKAFANYPEYAAALQNIAPKELKPGEAIKTKDGQLTYEELQEVVRNIDSVSPNDASLGNQKPRIYIFSELSDEQKKNPILEQLHDSIGSNLFSYSLSNTILIGEKFHRDNTSEVGKAAFAHERTHPIHLASFGFDTVEYNPVKHAALLGDNFTETCGDMSNLHQTFECYKTLDKLGKDYQSAENSIKLKTAELSRARESGADAHAAMAGYGPGMIEYNLKNNYEFPKDANPADLDHPSGKERISNIINVMANLAAAKEQFETKLAAVKKPALPVIEVGSEDKAPALTSSLVLEQQNHNR